jgi:hypothetical protein
MGLFGSFLRTRTIWHFWVHSFLCKEHRGVITVWIRRSRWTPNLVDSRNDWLTGHSE